MLKDTLIEDIEKIRANRPLVHNITNFVVMNSTANALLALGASPVMAHATEEMAEFVSMASALVINIGTLSTPWVDAMLIAAERAAEMRVPMILDPVGAGATSFRTKTCKELINTGYPAVIRGNASEIMALVDDEVKTKGVDSSESSDAAIQAACALAAQTGAVISISGQTDIITDGTTTIKIFNNNEIMTRVTGMGCTASALTGAFLAVNPDPLRAAAHAMALMGVAGKLASNNSSGPGSFQTAFLDALYNIDAESVRSILQFEERNNNEI